MPRNVRKQSKSGMYHVMLRGINRQELFHNEDDKNKMIEVLAKSTEISRVRLHGYCIMTNHVHLLAQTGEDIDTETLPQYMKRIGIRYAIYYNFMNSRVGSVFQDRYRSEAVETDAHFLTVLRYIHQNPVKAGITKSPADYIWSSYGNYIGKSAFVYTDMADSLLGENFENYMEEDTGTRCLDINDERKRLTDVELKMMVEDTLMMPISAIAALDRTVRNDALRHITAINGSTYRQISRLTGLSVGLIFAVSEK